MDQRWSMTERLKGDSKVFDLRLEMFIANNSSD